MTGDELFVDEDEGPPIEKLAVTMYQDFQQMTARDSYDWKGGLSGLQTMVLLRRLSGLWRGMLLYHSITRSRQLLEMKNQAHTQSSATT